MPGAAKWVDDGTAAKIELSITPRGQLKRLLSGLPLRFLHGNVDVLGEIVQFEGMTFNEATCRSPLQRHTANVQHRTSRRARACVH